MSPYHPKIIIFWVDFPFKWEKYPSKYWPGIWLLVGSFAHIPLAPILFSSLSWKRAIIGSKSPFSCYQNRGWKSLAQLSLHKICCFQKVNFKNIKLTQVFSG